MVRAYIENDNGDEGPGIVNDEFGRAIEILEETREKLKESQKLPPEKRREFWEKEIAKTWAKWPVKLLEECPILQDQVNEAFGYLMDFGYGDLKEVCNSMAFRESLKKMDLDECELNLQISEVAKEQGIPTALRLCLGFTLENYIKDELIKEGFDAGEVADSGLHDLDPRPISFYWQSDNEKLSERAKKIYLEE
ncbi:MAG: hypothetical protein PHZ19_03655 [Candidatus Thermoplasmatota archaeon]|nr:hypothetical protein [Candidatus Thermoplasmatota archaeon]